MQCVVLDLSLRQNPPHHCPKNIIRAGPESTCLSFQYQEAKPGESQIGLQNEFKGLILNKEHNQGTLD